MISVEHGNAFDLTPDVLRDAGAVALICDPPYSPHVHANAASHGSNGTGSVSRDLGFEPLGLPLMGHLARLAAACSRWSCIFTDLESIGLWSEVLGEQGSEYVRTVPWIRWSQPQLSGDRPCTGAEGLVVAACGELVEPGEADALLVSHPMALGPRGGRKPIAKRWNGPGSLIAFERRCLRSANKHPTEKPLDLLLDLVSYFSDPGELVIDPCAGAGTTALACRLLGRECYSVELDATWAERAARRVSSSVLSPRDQSRASEWCASVLAEASGVPAPKAADGSDLRTWERAQRRLADVERVRKALAS